MDTQTYIKEYWDDKFQKKGLIWGDANSKALDCLFLDENFKRMRNPRILEIGCGYGRDIKYLLDHGYTAAGIDISPVAIRIGRERWGNISIQELDFLHYPEDSDSLDVVYANFFYHLFTERETRLELIQKTHRILRRGGILFTIVSAEDDPDYKNGVKLSDHVVKNERGVAKYFYNKQLLDEDFGMFSRIEHRTIGEKHTHDFVHEHCNYIVICTK